MSFYDEVLRELLLATGAALFVANVYAIFRRRRDADVRGVRSGARSAKVKGSSRVRATGRTQEGELVQAPLGRSVMFAALGFVMMIAAFAAIVSS